jgi:signal transduction histidine kinase
LELNVITHLKMENQETENTANRNLTVLRHLNLASIFENTTDSVWAINSAYEILYANNNFISAFHESFGINLKPGTNILLSLPNSLRDVWKSRYDRALRNESFSFIDNIIAENISVYIEVFMNPIVINEEVIGALFFGKDITERKLNEKALIDSQLLLKSSLESQRDTILLSINKDYRYLYFNSAHAKVMKRAYGNDIEVGMNILDCISSDADRTIAKENYDRALRGETHSNIRIYGKENLAYYESFFNPIFNDKNEIIGATGLARDISERKKSELALLESERKLNELNSTKDKLFSIIAHDLRSPFNNIIGFSELLIEKVNDDTFTESEKFLTIINSSATNTLILLDNLLNWAKYQTGKINFKPVKIVFSNIILEVLKLEKSIAKAKNISLNYFTADEIEVYADENMLKIILRNLISNAIKFTKPGGEIRVFAILLKDWVEITISDNGIGINEEKLKELFNTSSNSSTTGTANEKGSGLGLMLCKDFIETHKGKIWAESKEGKGSEFKFTLPLSELDE